MINVPKPERVVAGLGKHSALVGSENTAVVIIDQCTKAGTGWTAQVHIADGSVRKHAREDQRGIELPKWLALPVDFQYPAQTTLVEIQPLSGIVFLKLLGLHRKPERRKGAQEDAVQCQV